MKYKNGDKSKIWLSIMASLLLVVITGTVLLVGYLSDGYRNWDKFRIDGPNQTVDGGGGAIIGDGDGNGIRIKSVKIAAEDYAANGISPLAENAYQLTATITPANVSETKAEWSLGFVDSESKWADGKEVTDYMTLTPTSEGSLTANVAILQAYGEPIVITVKTTDGTEYSATCICDYVKRIEKINLKVPKSSMSDDAGFDTSTGSGPYYVKLYPQVSATGSSLLTVSVEYGLGTVEDELTVTVDVRLSDGYYSILESKGYPIVSERPVLQNIKQFQNGKQGCEQLFGPNYFTQSGYANAVKASLSVAGPCMVFKVTAESEFNKYETEYSAFVKTDAMKILAEGISLSDTSLKF